MIPQSHIPASQPFFLLNRVSAATRQTKNKDEQREIAHTKTAQAKTLQMHENTLHEFAFFSFKTVLRKLPPQSRKSCEDVLRKQYQSQSNPS